MKVSCGPPPCQVVAAFGLMIKRVTAAFIGERMKHLTRARIGLARRKYIREQFVGEVEYMTRRHFEQVAL